MPTRRLSTRGRLPSGGPNPVDVHVGTRMKLRRTLLGMSQEGLAGMIGLTFQQIQKYERGANRISCSRLFDLAKALDVPVSFFFDDMPEEVRELSPVKILKGSDAILAIEERPMDPILNQETMKLVQAYYGITDERVRRRVYDLAKSLAEAGKDLPN